MPEKTNFQPKWTQNMSPELLKELEETPPTGHNINETIEKDVADMATNVIKILSGYNKTASQTEKTLWAEIDRLEKENEILNLALSECIMQFDYNDDEKWQAEFRERMIHHGTTSYNTLQMLKKHLKPSRTREEHPA